jgi:hypothetical protein
MCGLDHSGMKMGDDLNCTKKCVEAGSKYALADPANKVIYGLDKAGQEAAQGFAGRMVTVTGEIDKKSRIIAVTKIEAAN